MKSTEKIVVSVVIPCLNEEQTIKQVVRRAKKGLVKSNVRGEIVVVDNGSTDRSSQTALRAGARIVTCKKRGYGAALKMGFLHAKGKYSIMGDADGSYDFIEINKFVQKLREGYLFVIGSRYKGTIRKGSMPLLHKYIGTPVLTRVLNTFFHSQFSDCNSGMRGFRTSLIPALHLDSDGMEIASEMLVKTAILNTPTIEIPINYYPTLRLGRYPHLNTWVDGWRHLRFLLLYAPHYIFVFPGIVLFIVGSFLVLSQVRGKVVFGIFHFDLHFMILGIFLGLLGCTMMQLGIGIETISAKRGFVVGFLGSYIKKVFNFEKILIASIFLFLSGFTIDTIIFIQWIKYGFDKIIYWREALVSTYMMSIALQVIFFAFFYTVLLDTKFPKNNHKHRI